MGNRYKKETSETCRKCKGWKEKNEDSLCRKCSETEYPVIQVSTIDPTINGIAASAENLPGYATYGGITRRDDIGGQYLYSGNLTFTNGRTSTRLGGNYNPVPMTTAEEIIKQVAKLQKIKEDAAEVVPLDDSRPISFED